MTKELTLAQEWGIRALTLASILGATKLLSMGREVGAARVDTPNHTLYFDQSRPVMVDLPITKAGIMPIEFTFEDTDGDGRLDRAQHRIITYRGWLKGSWTPKANPALFATANDLYKLRPVDR